MSQDNHNTKETSSNLPEEGRERADDEEIGMCPKSELCLGQGVVETFHQKVDLILGISEVTSSQCKILAMQVKI